MDRVPADAEEAARLAIEDIRPTVELRRLRMRQAAGRYFADVVIGVSVDAAVGQGHAAADAVERAVQSALPEADVVVHVEPLGDRAEVRERAHAAALGVRRVREVHNVSVVSTDAGTEISLHLKLPGGLSLDEAHEIAEEVERAIVAALPEVAAVETHLEPLAEEAEGKRMSVGDVAAEHDLVARIVRDATGAEAESCASCTPTTGSSCTSPCGSRPARVSRRRTCGSEPRGGADPHRTARDRRRARAYGTARLKLCMFSPRERRARSRLARPHRGRPRRSSSRRRRCRRSSPAAATRASTPSTPSRTSCFGRRFCIRRRVRIFGRDGDFVFANPAAIHGPDDVVHVPEGASGIVPVTRLAAIVGAAGTIGGYTLMNDWEAPELDRNEGDRLRDIPRADRHHARRIQRRTLSTSRRLRIVPPRTRSSCPAI